MTQIMPIERVLPLLTQLKQSASRQWISLCPAHDDRSRSLSVSIGDEEQVLFHCHAGCTYSEVAGALGMEPKDLFIGGNGELDTRVRMLEIQQERANRELKEVEARLSKVELLQRSQIHLQYHRALTGDKRPLWYNEGLFDSAIDKFLLGWASRCPTAQHSQSMTIPVFDRGNALVNVRHRLMDPNGQGKYRPEMGGLGTSLFNAPILNYSHEQLLILEGEKKAMVLDQAGYPAVGIMGKSIWQREWFKWIDAGRVILALDPDAEEGAYTLGKEFVRAGFKDVRVATFPMKPDDWIARAGAGQKDVDAVLRWARPIHV